jgi:hypothetical protein
MITNPKIKKLYEKLLEQGKEKKGPGHFEIMCLATLMCSTSPTSFALHQILFTCTLVPIVGSSLASHAITYICKNLKSLKISYIWYLIG